MFNRCRLLVTRSESGPVFVPIRSMQYLAVLDREEVIFVDLQGGYAIHEGQGGRLITFAWQFPRDQTRDSLSAPVKLELVCYRKDARESHRRIMSEFPRALERYEAKQWQGYNESRRKRVVPFRSV